MQLPRKTFADTVKNQNQVMSKEVTQISQSLSIKDQIIATGKTVNTNTLETNNKFSILSNLIELGDVQEPREDISDNLHNGIGRNKENVAKKIVHDKRKTSENFDEIEKMLRELDGPSEFGKRPRATSEPSSPRKANNSCSPSSKCLKATSSEETIEFNINNDNPSENSSKIDSQHDTESKKASNIRPYKSLIRDYPMPPNDNKGAKSKIPIKTNRSSDAKSEDTTFTVCGHKTKGNW